MTVTNYSAKLELHRRQPRGCAAELDENKAKEASLAGWRMYEQIRFLLQPYQVVSAFRRLGTGHDC